jgi:protein-S-isoprenylcysteine O-methyltransferase Ste14
MKNLAVNTILGFAQLVLALGLFLFAPAWTFDFWQAWIYLLVFVTSSALITIYLWKKDPALLERRVKAGPSAENEKKQKLIQVFASLAFMGLMIVPSLDRRFSWSEVPPLVVIGGDVLVALGFFIVFLVFKENTFTAATIEVNPDQIVVSTGPYAVVRHPMYAGALIMLFGTPLALGSWWALLLFILMTFVIIWRLLDEEQFLAARLSGYNKYCEKVQYRLLPSIW